MNTDQRSQFNSLAGTDRLKRVDARISMDGKGRCIDNVCIERPWRSLNRGSAPANYQCVYLHAWETGSPAKAGIGYWITFYNHHRPHSSLGGTPPAVFYRPTITATNPTSRCKKLLNLPRKLSTGWE